MRRKMLSCFVVILMLLTSCAPQTAQVGKTLDRDGYSLLELEGDGFVTVAENEKLEMLCDPVTTEVAVKEKESGKIFYTNPKDRDNDTVANQYTKSIMSSQLVLTYVNDSNQISEINNFDYAVKNGQFSIYSIEDGIKIDYLLQEAKEEVFMPEVCTEEDFEENILPRFTKGSDIMLVKDSYGKTVMSEISAERKSEILAKYPDAENFDVIYVLYSSVKNQKLKRLSNAFEEAGFTLEEKAELEEKVGVAAAENQLWFTASLEYKLEEDTLVVSLPTEDLRSSEDYMITNVSVLPFFGAGNQSDEGFMFVPDGSGAVVDFADNPVLKTPVNLSFYGTDYSMLQNTDPEKQPSLRLPVYGIKSGDQAFMAILEDAASIATLKVSVAGQTSQYHSLQVGYIIRDNAEMKVPGISQASVVRVYQEQPYSSNCSIRYAFFSGEDTGYSDMANYYRDYLKQTGGLNQDVSTDKYPLYVNMLCAIDKMISTAGVPNDKTMALTTFEQAADMLETLYNNDVENTVMTLSGWNKGGVRGERPNAVRPDGSLGGKSGLQDLLNEKDSFGADVYLDWNGSYLSERSNSFFDTFVPSWHSASSIDQKQAYKREYNASEGTAITDEDWWYIYTPEYKKKLAENFLSSFESLAGSSGIALNWEGYDLNSDFNSNRAADRTTAMENDRQILESFAEKTNVMANGTNAYALAYVDFVQDVPVMSSRQEVYSYDVPFYQMVIHGNIPYAAQTRNFTSLDEQIYFLKLLETGSSPAYFLSCNEDSILKSSAFNKWYSLDSENWLDSLLELYSKAADVLRPLSSSQIVEHVRLEEDVYSVVYEDAAKIYINYSSSQVTVDGVTIPPQSYQVVEL